MLFNSFEFLVFFVVVTGLYFLLPHRYRWAMLLGASLFFYGYWKAEYLLLIGLTVTVDYTVSNLMQKMQTPAKRKALLYLSMTVNMGLLFAFKYLGFLTQAANDLVSFLGVSYALPMANLLLPVGISFYTFQTMSYTLDVYHGRMKPEKHYGIFFLFISFYPQLVAGPIERATHLLPQFHVEHHFSYSRLVEGLRLIMWGLFKKVVIADRLSLFVNEIYNHPTEYQGLTFAAATFFFAFQIYCDFSGYSDIAIGAARVLGFDLMTNFRTPYFSASIREFWSRWHISLSTWFRDYLYIPLGGNRVAKWRWYYNLVITFLVSGVWHGANWTFIVWGALHGLYQVVGLAITTPLRKKMGITGEAALIRTYDVVSVFVLACFAWIFFRANTISDALYIVKEILNVSSFQLSQLHHSVIAQKSNNVYPYDVILGWIWIVVLVSLEKLHEKYPFATWSPNIRMSAYIVGVIVMYLFGVTDKSDFIYFQF